MPANMSSRANHSSSSLRILPQGFSALARGSTFVADSSTRLSISEPQIGQLRYLSEMTYPFEACGLFIGRMIGNQAHVLEVLQAQNLSENGARDRYVLDPEDFLTAERCARDRDLEIIGIWHSHPNHPAEPSTRDLESAWHGYSYVIVSVDALGDTVVRSWRLRGSRLTGEPIEVRHAV